MENKEDTAKRNYRIAIAVFFFTGGFTFSSWASRIPQIQADLGLNEILLGSVLFTLPIGLMVSLLITGALVARFGSKTMLIISSLAYSLILVMIGLCQQTWQLVLALFFFGIAANMFNISVNTQAVGVEKMYGRSIMASFHGVWSLAGFTGAAFGTLIVYLQVPPLFHFMLSAIICWFLILFFQKNTIRTTEKKSGPVFALPDKYIFQIGLIAFGCLLCEGTMFDWSGVYFKKAVQAPEQLISLGYAAFMGCMATGRFLADRVVTNMGARKTLIFSGLIIFSGFMLAVMIPTVLVATIGFMLVGFGVSSVVPIVYSRAGQSKTMHPGQALAAVTSVGFAGFLAGPPFIGFVAEASSLRFSFALVALVGLATSLLAKRVFR
jgi:MFS family permease